MCFTVGGDAKADYLDLDFLDLLAFLQYLTAIDRRIAIILTVS
jgi:hypothetical protein